MLPGSSCYCRSLRATATTATTTAAATKAAARANGGVDSRGFIDLCQGVKSLISVASWSTTCGWAHVVRRTPAEVAVFSRQNLVAGTELDAHRPGWLTIRTRANVLNSRDCWWRSADDGSDRGRCRRGDWYDGANLRRSRTTVDAHSCDWPSTFRRAVGTRGHNVAGVIVHAERLRARSVWARARRVLGGHVVDRQAKEKDKTAGKHVWWSALFLKTA